MEKTVKRESVKLSDDLIKKLRVAAERDGMRLNRLVERLIESGIKAEKYKV